MKMMKLCHQRTAVLEPPEKTTGNEATATAGKAMTDLFLLSINSGDGE